MLIRKGMDLSENERISKLQLDTNLRKGAALLLLFCISQSQYEIHQWAYNSRPKMRVKLVLAMI